MNFLRDPRVQLIAGLLLITALFVTLVRLVLHRFAHAQTPDGNGDPRLRRELLRAALGPASLLVWYYGLWAMGQVAIDSDWVPAEWQWLDDVLWRIASVGVFLSGLWFFYRATRIADQRLKLRAAGTESRLDDVILPLIGTTLRLTVPILTLFLFTRLSRMPAETIVVANKLLAIALIAALTWILRRGILLVDLAVIGPRSPSSPAERALFTRVRVLRKIATAIVMVFAVAAVLMTFEEVRDLGRSLLASAGVAGIVIGFAAQRSLGNLFAGLQIALTQPVRIGDQVLVEGDVGNVEEITLTYVVVCVWDQRRIVLPISYFIEKPFQNWTRVPTNMLSPLTLRVDFSLPIGDVRDYLRGEIEKSANWDKKVFGVQVTDADDRSMEIRVLASAPDAGASFNLRCELRERAIDYIRRNYPQCLPKQRREQKMMEAWHAWTEPFSQDGAARTEARARPTAPAR